MELALRRILVIRLSSIGDVVMATPMAEALKARFPEAFLGWAVAERCKEVVEGNPFVDEVFSWDGTLAGLLKLGRELRRGNFGLVVEAQGHLRSGVLAWLSKASLRLGFSDAKEGSVVFLTHKGPARDLWRRPQEIYLRLLSPLGIEANSDRFRMSFPVGDEDREWARNFLHCHGLEEREFVALGPGTRMELKLWPARRWVEVVKGIWERLGLASVIVGSWAEFPLAEGIASNVKGAAAAVAAGKGSLKQSAALIEMAKVYVGVDSGPLFVSLAVGTPVVGIFGPTRFDLLKEEPLASVVSKQNFFPCAPCKKHPRCKRGGEGARPCMEAIEAEEVLEAVERRLEVER